MKFSAGLWEVWVTEWEMGSGQTFVFIILGEEVEQLLVAVCTIRIGLAAVIPDFPCKGYCPYFS